MHDGIEIIWSLKVVDLSPVHTVGKVCGHRESSIIASEMNIYLCFWIISKYFSLGSKHSNGTNVHRRKHYVQNQYAKDRKKRKYRICMFFYNFNLMQMSSTVYGI